MDAGGEVMSVCDCVRGRSIQDGHLNNKEAMVEMSVVCVCVRVCVYVCGLMWPGTCVCGKVEGHVLFCFGGVKPTPKQLRECKT